MRKREIVVQPVVLKQVQFRRLVTSARISWEQGNVDREECGRRLTKEKKKKLGGGDDKPKAGDRGSEKEAQEIEASDVRLPSTLIGQIERAQGDEGRDTKRKMKKDDKGTKKISEIPKRSGQRGGSPLKEG